MMSHKCLSKSKIEKKLKAMNPIITCSLGVTKIINRYVISSYFKGINCINLKQLRKKQRNILTLSGLGPTWGPQTKFILQ